MDRLARAIDSVRRRAEEHEALLRALVEVNSYTANKPGGDEVVSRLEEALSIPSLLRVRHRSERFADHLVVETAAGRASAHTLCIGHHDTVFPPGSFDGYRREGNTAYGPGVLDMKGGLVVVVAALRALAEAGALEDVPLRLISVGDEEVGSPESQPLVRAAARGAACALGFESGRPDDRIVTARKGTASLRVVAHGKAAHAGNDHASGGNAIWALARFVDRVQGLTDYDRGLTVNVGRIEGGQAKNTVPDRAEALVDLRFVTVGDGEALRRAVERLVGEAGVPRTRLDVEWLSWRHPLVRTEASAALASAYGECQQAAGLGDGEEPLVGGGSDAATAALEGVPAIDGLGPRGTGYHTRDERIDLGTLVPKAEALVRFLLRRRAA